MAASTRILCFSLLLHLVLHSRAAIIPQTRQIQAIKPKTLQTGVVNASRITNGHNVTVTFSGYFNITTTITLDNQTYSSLLSPNTSLSRLPWSLSTGFNFSASHGPVQVSAGGGAGGGGNGRGGGGGGGTNETGGAAGGGGGIGGHGGGVGLGAAVRVNGQTISGIGAADAFAEGGGGAAATGGGGGCAMGGGSAGGKSGVGRGCSNEVASRQFSLKGGDSSIKKTIEEVVRRNSTGYGRADGIGSGGSVGVASGNGTNSRAYARSSGASVSGRTASAAFGMGNGGGAGSATGGSKGGEGWVVTESNKEAGRKGIGIGMGRASGTHTGGGSGVAASGGSNATAFTRMRELGEQEEDDEEMQKVSRGLATDAAGEVMMRATNGANDVVQANRL